jgi:opacity protein-like surface antigen
MDFKLIDVMKKLLLLILIALSMSAGAQEHTIGVRGGLNFTNITGADYYRDMENRKGMNAGITYEWQLPGKIRLGMDVLYSEQGYIDYFVEMDEFGNKGNTYEIKNNYDYLSVPIKIGYAIGEKIKLIPRIGIVTSYLLNAETILPAMTVNGETYESQTYQLGNIRKFDLAGLAELGVEFKLSDHLLLEPDLAYKYSFNGIHVEKLIGVDIEDMRHIGFAASVGVRYVLKD